MSGGTLLKALEHGAAKDPALVVPGGPQLSYGQLREQVSMAADRLAQHGLGRGDRVALVLPNSAESVVLFLAAAVVGTAAPLNPAYKEEEFRFYLQDTAARALVVPRGEGEAARRALPEDVALIEARIDHHGQLVLRASTPATPAGPRRRPTVTTSPSSSTPAAPPAGPSWFRSGSATWPPRPTTSRRPTGWARRMSRSASCRSSTSTG